jgi:hypothetical protein
MNLWQIVQLLGYTIWQIQAAIDYLYSSSEDVTRIKLPPFHASSSSPKDSSLTIALRGLHTLTLRYTSFVRHTTPKLTYQPYPFVAVEADAKYSHQVETFYLAKVPPFRSMQQA